MSKFVCSKCKSKKTVSTYTIKVMDGKSYYPEATCCDTYMDKIREHGGWGAIRRGPDGTVKRKPRPWE